MYGRIKEEKLRTNNIVFSVEKVKNELEGYIDVENKRVNIDSAKKRAVMQGLSIIQIISTYFLLNTSNV